MGERDRKTVIVGRYVIERALFYSSGYMTYYDAAGAAWKVQSGRPVRQIYWRVTENGKWKNSFLTAPAAKRWARSN